MKTTHDAILQSALDVFMNLLRREWFDVERLTKTLEPSGADAFLSDWAQGNWELIVEAPIAAHVAPGRTFLEPYGEGADCNAIGSRVWMPGAKSTHAVHCVPRSGDVAWDHLLQAQSTFPATGMPFDRFATHTETGWYVEKPPFDFVLISSMGRESLFRLADVRFILHEIEHQKP